MLTKTTELKLVKTVADRAMEIHRKNKKIIPLAIYEATSEVGNITKDRQKELQKEVQKELIRRSQRARDAQKKRRDNKWHGGVMSSIRHARKKLEPR